MASSPYMMPLKLAPQRAMFALEFRDPIRGELVADGLRVTAEGLGPPTVTPSNRFVWVDRDLPADRRIRIEVVSTNRRFARVEMPVDMPAEGLAVPLTPTGLYEPPAGMVAVGGMLVEGAGSRTAIEGASIRIHFRYAEGMERFTGPYRAVTDHKGGFMAVIGPLGDVRPDPDRDNPGTFKAWLLLQRGDEVRVSALSLRPGRLVRIAAPLEWAALRRSDIEEDEFVEE